LKVWILCLYFMGLNIPTVSPLLTPVTSRNISSLQSLPHSIPYRQDKVRRRKDGFCRKVRCLGQNLKIGYQKFNDLQTAKISKKQLCDRTPYWAVVPPSMTNSLPVTKDDSSEARYNTP